MELPDEMELITVEEAAERLHVGRGTLYKLLNDKTNGIKAFRINRTWKIPAKSINEFIERKSGLTDFMYENNF